MKTVNLAQGEHVTLFNTLSLEIASKCNRMCYFCPNGYFKRPDVFMPEELVEKALKELRSLKYSGRIEWYIYNEPTRDKRLTHFIILARKLLPRVCQMINTNGDYFRGPEDIQRLFDAGLNQMQINIYSANDKYWDKDPQRFRIGVEKAQARERVLRGWVAEAGIPGTESLYTNIGPRKRSCKVVAKYGVTPTIKNSEVSGPNLFANRSGLIPGFRGATPAPLKKSCTRPFRIFNINYNGDALLCCNDYLGTVTFGNLKDCTLVDMWNDPRLNQYRLSLQSKNRALPLCDVCDFTGGPYPHMVDTLLPYS